MNNLSARWCRDVSDLTAGGTVGQEMLHTHKETEKFEYFMTSYKPVKGHTSIFFPHCYANVLSSRSQIYKDVLLSKTKITLKMFPWDKFL